MDSAILNDLLELVNNAIPGNRLFLGRTTENTFTIIHTIDKEQTGIELHNNQTVDLNETYCQQIFSNQQKPVIINDALENSLTKELAVTSEQNIRSYVGGVPVFYKDGDMYGTLCAINPNKDNFSYQTVELLKKFSRLFSYVIELERQATIDKLTNTYNRNYLFDHFYGWGGKYGILMAIDLDGFKQVNDTYGHSVGGDQVLLESTNRIKHIIRKGDALIRLGGDEFILILPHADQQEIRGIAERILASLGNWSEYTLPITLSASLGIVQYTDEALTTLLNVADQALYQAKEKGKSNYVVVNED
ncbi:sensory box/GGDEF family protein [Gracilibacillus boraciitolerans JCM 21714]|uniref:Sensory box/GGDEF family protein n=1 Tax=Gracilibacillus boraciitolerans JCM 21714 TaxID=1298598 RepID=W4VKN5_9BACI|nr:sensor domain-containing diguanylate cyclase [Gracilibacillus boraciitolerans]GAE93334.1 sensory box/GGDEF family protein [Gracilibacillus boraciitolerans JCM 21714]